jgi:hypothetical protein
MASEECLENLATDAVLHFNECYQNLFRISSVGILGANGGSIGQSLGAFWEENRWCWTRLSLVMKVERRTGIGGVEKSSLVMKAECRTGNDVVEKSSEIRRHVIVDPHG